MIDYAKALEVYERGQHDTYCQYPLNNKEVVMSDKVINTRRLQIFTLMFFMQAEHGCIFDGTGFVGQSDYTFNEAVKMYNAFADKDIYGYFFHTLKLQYSKGEKKIIVQSHLLKFTDDFNEQCQAAGITSEQGLVELMNAQRLR